MLETSSQPETDRGAASPGPGGLGDLPDRVLLRRFQQARDEEALAEIVTRHAPLVMAACRRGTPTIADADDAFQATFLVLAQSAAKIRRRDALASWLYGVATRACLRLRRQAARLPVHEAMDTPAELLDPLDELLARHDETIADEELSALPDALRQPLVLRYLAGKSNAETAAELGLSVAALEGRLKRGKQRLRMRLLRRGVTLAAIAAVLKGSRAAAESFSPELMKSTIELCVAGSAGALPAAGSPAATSTPATTLALEEIAAMPALTVAKPLVVALLVVAGAAVTAVGPLAFAEGDPTSAPGGVAINVAVEEGPAEESGAVQLTAAPKTNKLTRARQGGEANPFADATDPFGSRPVASEDGSDPFAAGFGVASHPFEDEEHLADERLSLVAGDNSLSETESSKVPVDDGAATQTKTAAYKPFDLKQRTASEVAIEQALNKALPEGGLDCSETPLEEIVECLRAEYEIPIHIDRRGLAESGITPSLPISVALRRGRLDSALRLMLRTYGLTYTVSDEVLLITTENAAAQMYEVRIYPHPAPPVLMAVIKQTVTPNVWTDGEARMYILDKRLLVRQTYAGHAEISKLMSELQRTAPEVGERATPRR